MKAGLKNARRKGGTRKWTKGAKDSERGWRCEGKRKGDRESRIIMTRWRCK